MSSRSDADDRVVRVGVWKPGSGCVDDCVAAEAPLELRVDGVPLAVTMRTPGDDHDLAAGYAFFEGLIAGLDDLAAIVAVDDVPPAARGHVLDLRRRGEARDRARPARRQGLVVSACGICGHDLIDVTSRRAAPLPAGTIVSAATLLSLPDALHAQQRVFSATGGVHAAGLFHADGRPIVTREDIGRHNAVDKVIGHALRERLLPLSATVLMVSGRVAFEIVAKAWLAGIPVVASVSAPSSFAVQLAEEADMTLVGFVRGESFTAYTGRHRIVS